MQIWDEQQIRLVESVANEDGRVWYRECGESKALEFDGHAVRYKGDIRFGVVCKNGHKVDMLLSEDGARRIDLPVAAYRRRARRRNSWQLWWRRMWRG